MGLIGSIVGGVGSFIGGIAAAKAQNKAFSQQQSIFNQRMDDVRAHRNNMYYQDPTQTAASQAAVTNARELLNEQAKNAAATAAVAGGTTEDAALQKKQAAKVVGDMIQQQAVQGEAKKEAIWSDADRQLDAFSSYLANSKLQQGTAKAQNIANAASQLSTVSALF